MNNYRDLISTEISYGAFLLGLGYKIYETGVYLSDKIMQLSEAHLINKHDSIVGMLEENNQKIDKCIIDLKTYSTIAMWCPQNYGTEYLMEKLKNPYRFLVEGHHEVLKQTQQLVNVDARLHELNIEHIHVVEQQIAKNLVVAEACHDLQWIGTYEPQYETHADFEHRMVV